MAHELPSTNLEQFFKQYIARNCPELAKMAIFDSLTLRKIFTGKISFQI